MRFVNLSLLMLLIVFPADRYSQRGIANNDLRESQRLSEEQAQRSAEWARRRDVINDGLAKKNAGDSNPKDFFRQAPEPNKEDLEQIAVPAAAREKFGALLKQKDTGIFKLFDALDCDEEDYLLDARRQCPNGFIGKATSFSFRVKKYREKSFSDIFLENENISVRGFNVFGIIAELGEIPLEKVTLSLPGVRELSELRPATRVSDLKRHVGLLRKGVQVGDYVFRSSAKLKPNTTYLLRSIAYKSKSMPDIKKVLFTFDSWSKDKRHDVMVVFHCVKKNDDNSWVLVWKELARTNAPEL